MSAAQIARRCRTKPDLTKKLLTACTAMGLLEKRGEGYANTELSKTYLVRASPLYQGDIIAHNAFTRSFWNSLDDEIRLKPSAEHEKPNQHRNFIMGMHNVAVAVRAKLFLDVVELSGRERLFDVGGGPGTYSIAACKRYRQLSAVVFDLPETVEIAKEVITAAGMQERVNVRAGSWETDDFGCGNDVVLLSDVIHGPASNAEMKLQKAYDSMVDGGLLVVQEFLLNDEGTGPLAAAFFDMMVGAFSEGELLCLIRQAKFLKPRVVHHNERIGSAWITAHK